MMVYMFKWNIYKVSLKKGGIKKGFNCGIYIERKNNLISVIIS